MLSYLSLFNLFYDLRFLTLSYSENVLRMRRNNDISRLRKQLYFQRRRQATAGNTSVLSSQAMILLESPGTLLNIRFSKNFVFRPWNISHLPPLAKSLGSYGCERRFFSCYHDSRNNFVSPKFYSQILKERANGIHQKKDVLAIVFHNMPFSTDILCQTPSTFSWRLTRFSRFFLWACRVSQVAKNLETVFNNCRYSGAPQANW